MDIDRSKVRSLGISIDDVSKTEGRNGRTTLFTFTITLSGAYDQPVTVSFSTVNGTATTGNGDYVVKSGTLTFAPGACCCIASPIRGT